MPVDVDDLARILRHYRKIRDGLEGVLEDIESAIEDLEIATNPDVHAALNGLIAEVTCRKTPGSRASTT